MITEFEFDLRSELESQGCGIMDEDRFRMLMDVLRILEKYENEGTKESILEIIDTFDTRLSSDQKASVLSEFLHIKRKADERKKRFDEHVEKQHMENFLHGDYF